MTSRTSTRESHIHIRTHLKDRELIDRAAEAVGKSRSEFVIESARQQAQEVLREQRVFHLDATAWKTFMHELDAPPARNPKLNALLKKKSPWAK